MPLCAHPPDKNQQNEYYYKYLDAGPFIILPAEEKI